MSVVLLLLIGMDTLFPRRSSNATKLIIGRKQNSLRRS
jgi:hypothetical protein